MEMNRRTLAKGAAWAAPVVVASAAVPAYAASQEPCSTGGSFVAPAPTDANGATTTWTVPAGVTSICFDVLGGAGGGYSAANAGGAGARVTGVLPVSPGDQLTLVVGSGGLSEKASWARAFGTLPTTGGKGYGDGGDAAAAVTSDANVLTGSHVFVQRFGGSGGAGSAILLNGQPVVIAGGGGGNANSPTFGGVWPGGSQWKGKPAGSTNANNNHPAASDNTTLQAAGSAGGDSADATGVTTRNNKSSAVLPGAVYSFGSGAKAGVGGAGGATGPNDVFTNDTAYVHQIRYVAGGAGESVAAPGPAKGGSGAALDHTYKYVDSKSVRAVSIGAGGGGGYGGGGAGSSTGFDGTWEGSTDGQNYYGVLLSAGNAGAAGGSYVAPSVAGGAIAQGNNTNTTGGIRNHGAISFTF